MAYLQLPSQQKNIISLGTETIDGNAPFCGHKVSEGNRAWFKSLANESTTNEQPHGETPKTFAALHWNNTDHYKQSNSSKSSPLRKSKTRTIAVQSTLLNSSGRFQYEKSCRHGPQIAGKMCFFFKPTHSIFWEANANALGAQMATEHSNDAKGGGSMMRDNGVRCGMHDELLEKNIRVTNSSNPKYNIKT